VSVIALHNNLKKKSTRLTKARHDKVAQMTNVVSIICHFHNVRKITIISK
jgi:hypothetical protein